MSDWRERFRKESQPRLKLIAPPPFVFGLPFALGVGLDQLLGGGVSPGPARLVIAGVLIAVSAAIMAWTLFELRRHGESPDPGEATGKIVDSGPFAFSRNPIYAAFLIAEFGVWIAVGGWLTFLGLAASAVTGHYLVILPEERHLEESFGQEYREYCQRVGRWIYNPFQGLCM
ncbi:MAG: methyltransferase family protein [Chloroflexota bacterium]